MDLRASLLLLVLIALAVTWPLVTVASPEIREYIVDLKAGTQTINELSEFGCSVLRVFKYFGLALAACPKSIEGYSLSYIMPNLEVTPATTGLRVYGSLDSYGSYEGSYTTAWSWAVSRVGADIVWTYTKLTGSGLVVAVLDTGIDPDHPLLAGKLVTTNPGDPTYPGGWIEFDRQGRPVCTRPRDTYGHGTWVSSILVGGDGSTYVFGVVPGAQLRVANVLPGGSGTFAQVLAGLEWVLEPYDCRGRPVDAPRPVVVSMSLGALGNYSNVLLPAIRKLIEAGITPVAAIGNGGPYTSSNPGNIWGVIGVGATDFEDEVTYFSSYELVEWPSPPESWPFKGYYPRTYRKPDVVAPGTDIVGAYPGALLAIGSGTSAATPLAAGVAALVAGELRKQGLSGAKLVEAVYDTLTSTATQIDHPGAGYGRLRAYLAVSRALNKSVRPASVNVFPGRVEPGKAVKVVLDVIPGTYVNIYISGVRVYSGAYQSGGVVVTVPLTHIGGNIVVAVAGEGTFYGETLVSASPSLVVGNNMTSGNLYDLLLTGLGIGDTIAVYLAGNILTLDSANLRGSLHTKFMAPYTNTSRTLQILVRDFTTPEVSLSAAVVVGPPVARPEVVVPTELAIHVNARNYYTVGKPDTLQVLSPQELVNLTVRQVYPESAVVAVLNTTLVKNLAVVAINVTRYPNYGVVFLEISACSPSTCSTTLSSLNVVLEEPTKPLSDALKSLAARLDEVRESLKVEQGEVARLSEVLRSLSNLTSTYSKDIESLRSSYTKLEALISNTTGRIALLEQRVRELDTIKVEVAGVGVSLEELRGSCGELSTSISQYRTVTTVLLVISGISLVVALIALYRTSRRP